MNHWKATHRIHGHPLGPVEVMLCEQGEDGASAYTLAEWSAEVGCDWTVEGDGSWLFQGQVPGYAYWVERLSDYPEGCARCGLEVEPALERAYEDGGPLECRCGLALPAPSREWLTRNGWDPGEEE